jgi:hypothetical protein
VFSAPLFNITFKDGETGQKIVALTNNNVFIYTKSGLYNWNSTSNGVFLVNTSQPGGWTESPALVGYGTGFFVHGGLNGTMPTSNLYYYDGAGTWAAKNSSAIPPASNHIATISTYPTEPGGNPSSEAFIFFTGIPEYSIALFDVNNNVSWIPKTKYMVDALDMPLTTIAGAQLFTFGGRNRNTSMVMADLYQFVNERYCTSVSTCDDCVGYFGCTFCSSPVSAGQPQCVAGNTTKAYITDTCGANSQFISSIETCPEAFPSWAIALIVIGGVILVGGIVFGIMKLRAVNKQGYEPV